MSDLSGTPSTTEDVQTPAEGVPATVQAREPGASNSAGAPAADTAAAVGNAPSTAAPVAPAAPAGAPAAPPSAEPLREPADRAFYESLKAGAQKPPAESAAPRAPTPTASQADQKRPARRGRKANPQSQRAARTYREKVRNARTPAELEEAHAFGRAAGLPRVDGRTGPTSHEAAPTEEEIPEVEAIPEDDEPAEKPRAKFMGQDAERVEMYAGAILPMVETLVDLVRRNGVDHTAPRKRVIFRGTPLEREISADPVSRITELLAVEASERFTPKEGPEGETAEPSKSDRRVELAILGAVAAGPLALPLLEPLKRLPAVVVGTVTKLIASFTRRRAT